MFVYLIKRRHGEIKIGIASDVKKRLSSLATGSLDELAILYSMRVGQAARHIEDGFKALMRFYHVRGEWYECDDDTIAMLALRAAAHGDMIAASIVKAVIAWRTDGGALSFNVEQHDYIERRIPEWASRIRSIRERQGKPLLRVNIYPETWNNARLEAKRRKRPPVS